MSPDNQEPEKGQILLYQTADQALRLECRFLGDTLWLSLNQMAELFGRDKSVISKHLKAIYDDEELLREATVAKYATVQMEGSRNVERQIEYFNLEAIFAVGYRVRSKQGIQFRTWATSQLKELTAKGFVMDDERLKSPDSSVYFEQLLARIRDIPRQKRCSGARYVIFMQLALITMVKPKPVSTFLHRYKTKCIGRHMATLPLN